MDLSQVRGKLGTSQLLTWNSTTGAWNSTGIYGSLQAYDRPITDMAFKRKNRVFVIGATSISISAYRQVKIEGGSGTIYLPELITEDVSFSSLVGYTMSLRETNTHGGIYYRSAGPVRGSGIPSEGVDVLRESVWSDVLFYGATQSSEFDTVKYPTFNLTFPFGTIVNREDYYLADTGEKYEVMESHRSDNLVVARAQRVG